jgi:hypothetical protein
MLRNEPVNGARVNRRIASAVLLIVACVAIAGVVAATAACPMTCTEMGCAGGFEWTGRPVGGATLAPGDYAFAITLEDDSFEIECHVGATYGESDCGAPVHVSGEIDYDVLMSFAEGDGEWDSAQPPAGFVLLAADGTGSHDLVYTTRGPTRVTIAATLDGTPLVDADYALEFSRVEDFNGEGCGYCDDLQARTDEW